MPIFDQGYQHWSGQLSGHSWRWLAIARHGLRIGLKSRIIRLALLVSWLPAAGLVFMLCVWGLVERQSATVAQFAGFLRSMFGAQVVADPLHYRVEVWTIFYDYFLLTQLRFSMILVLLVGPNLISQDLRYNALPLYLSRPLRRRDYFLGKLGVITAFLGLVVILPSVVAYAFGLLFSLDASIVGDTLPILVASVIYGLIIAVSAGTLMLALSSLSRNSRYVALMWVGLWFVSGITGTILQQANNEQRIHEMRREDPRNIERSRAELMAAEVDNVKADWRPIVSYTANLQRLGQQLLGTNACWESLSQWIPPKDRGRFLLQNLGPEYPWYWSAAVLTGLFFLSLWLLNLRIKSLDRLK